MLSSLKTHQSHMQNQITELFGKARATSVIDEDVFPETLSVLDEWALFLDYESAKLAALNCFRQGSRMLSCDIWYPAFEEEKLIALLALPEASFPGFLITETAPAKDPPTYFRNTGFTLGFQNFVDTYGYPRYRELNPALITSVTLPYFYGVMYGDLGHGIFTLLAGLGLIYGYPYLKHNKDEMVQMVTGGRYMILLMGIFAMYTGIIYNDFMALGFDIFGTRYQPEHLIQGGTVAVWAPKPESTSFPYPFGFDPVWKGASNELTFQNSFKMKFSIIMAFLHMGFGTILKGVNYLLNNNRIGFVHEFVPQIIFFVLFVGYMNFLIIYKWIFPGTGPGLISAIIEFAMLKTPEQPLYANQAVVQKIMFVGMVICIPWMLIPKPFLEKRHHANAAAALRQEKAERKPIVDVERCVSQDTSESHETSPTSLLTILTTGGMTEEDSDEETYDFGEEMTHQLIETIEFALGAVSNTASYLRLWALSLAHQQLSVVFFEMILMKGLEADVEMPLRVLISIFCFFGFSLATVLVMLCMDALECYLHALRLHWVEFQGKFFKADGHPFIAFKFE